MNDESRRTDARSAVKMMLDTRASLKTPAQIEPGASQEKTLPEIDSKELSNAK